MLVDDCLDRVHVAGPAVQLNRHDGSRAFCDFPLHRSRIDHVIGTHVGQHGRCADKMHGGGGCDIRVRWHDDFVPFADTHRPQAQDHRVGTVGDAIDVFDAEIFLQRILELGEVFLQDEGTAG